MAATAAVVDLSNVKEGGNFRPKHKPEGDYKAKVVKADDHQPKDKTKKQGWVLTIQVEGDARSSYPYYLSPEDNQLWKIGGICRAVGLKVPTGRMKFDPNKLVNRSLGVALEDDEYDGKVKSTIGDVFPVSEVSPNADPEPDDDDVDLPDDEPEIDDDEEEEEEEPEPTPPPRKRTARKPTPPPVEEDDDEEDEEEPPPPPRRTRKAAVKKAAPPPVDDEDDDLDDLDLDELD